MSISSNNNLTQMKEYKVNACNFLDYMHFFMSDLFFDINKLTPFLSSSVSEDIKAIHITSVYATLKYTEDNRKRKGKYTREECYKKYCELLGNNIPPLEKGLFKTVFDSLSYINLDSNYLDCSEKSREAIELWKNSGETDDSIIKLLSVIANKHPNLANEAIASSARTLKNTDIYTFQSDFFSIMKSLRTNNELVDALCYATHDPACNDITVENSLIYNSFTSQVGTLTDDDVAFVILPTIFLIRQFIRDNHINKKHIVFFLKDETQANLLRRLFPFNSTFEFKDILSLDKYIMDGCVPTTSIIFGNHFLDETEKCKIAGYIIKSARDQHTLYVFDADNSIENPSFQFHGILSNTRIDSVYILPGNISRSTSPKRKMLLRCSYGYVKVDDSPITISQFMLKTDSRNQLLSCKTLQTQITHSDFANGNNSLRSIFRSTSENYYRRSDKTECKAKSVEFTPEITVYYTFSKSKNNTPRLKAYIRNPESGAIIQESILSTTRIPENEAEVWAIKEYPQATVKRTRIEIRDEIRKAYLPYCQTRIISLKSFLYLYDISLPQYAKNEFALFNSCLGDYPLSSITPVHIQSLITENYINRTRKITANQALSILKRIFDLATENNYCISNPARDVHLKELVDKTELYNVRANLTKKFLTQKELTQLLKYCDKKIRSGHFGYTGIIIRLFTGIEANSVVSLKWKDLIEIKHNGIVFYSFVVRRCTDNKASCFQSFNSLEQRRMLPCPSILYQYIQNEMTRQMIEYDLTKDEIKDFAIVPGSDSIINGQTRIMGPKTLNLISREAIKKLNIEPDVIPLPDDFDGTTETNLAFYGGDIFARNIKHQMVKAQSFNEGEIAYVLGNKSQYTFYRHYCDLARSDSQYKLLQKITLMWENLINAKDI